jgi:thiamine pyrophosphate-dependent acetolactate synthase large subunit-like protein
VVVMKPITQFSAAIDPPDTAGEPIVNQFRAAMAPRPGICFIAFSRDVQSAADEAGAAPSLPLLPLGAAPADMIRKDAELSRVLSYLGLCIWNKALQIRCHFEFVSHTEGFQNSNRQL